MQHQLVILDLVGELELEDCLDCSFREIVTTARRKKVRKILADQKTNTLRGLHRSAAG